MKRKVKGHAYIEISHAGYAFNYETGGYNKIESFQPLWRQPDGLYRIAGQKYDNEQDAREKALLYDEMSKSWN